MSGIGDRTLPAEGEPDGDGRPVPSARSDASRSQTDRTLPLPRAGRDEMPKVPGVEVTRKIGEGGMGVVYVGVQSFLGRQVAVKFLGPEHQGGTFAAHFHREARLLAEMKHANIVACYQADFTPDGDCYLVMEYIDGPNLRQWIEEHGALSMRTALLLCREVAHALQHAFDIGVAHHGSGIIHRDVKPENVLLARNPKAVADDPFPFVVKLADLGLARPSARGPEQVHLTQHGAAVGTPSTMAPEQYDDPEGIDFRADVYGLGCVLYHALTGRPAFQGATISAILSQKLAPFGPDPRKHVPALPKAVSAFVKRMLARDRAARHASYAELLLDVDRLIAETGDARASRIPKPAWIALAAVVLALGVGAVFALRSEEVVPVRIVDNGGDEDPSDKGKGQKTDPGGDDQPDRPGPDPGPAPDPVPPDPAPPAITVAASSHPPAPQEGEWVDLEASASDTEEDLVVVWTQTGGPYDVDLVGGEAARVRFVAPESAVPYELAFEATATYRGESEPVARHALSVSIDADDDPPNATVDLPPDEIAPGDEIVLVGRAHDPEGRTDLEYRWSAPEQVPAIGLDASIGSELRFEAPDFDRNYESMLRLVVRDRHGSSAPIDVLVPVRVDPALAPLPPGARTELFPKEKRNLMKPWLADDPDGSFTAIPEERDHYVQATAPAADPGALCRQSYPLPRGKWRLAGSFWLQKMRNDQPHEAGLFLETSSLAAIAIKLIRTGPAVHVEVSRIVREHANAPWRLDSVLATDAETWRLQDRLDFEVVWNGSELAIARSVHPHQRDSASEADGRSDAPDSETRTDSVESARPRLLTLFVRGRQAFFENLVLEGM